MVNFTKLFFSTKHYLTVSTGLGSDPFHGGGSHLAGGILLVVGTMGPRFTPDMVDRLRVSWVVSFKLLAVKVAVEDEWSLLALTGLEPSGVFGCFRKQ